MTYVSRCRGHLFSYRHTQTQEEKMTSGNKSLMTKLAPLLLYTNTPCGMSLWWYSVEKENQFVFIIFLYFLSCLQISLNNPNYGPCHIKIDLNLNRTIWLLIVRFFLRCEICDITANIFRLDHILHILKTLNFHTIISAMKNQTTIRDFNINLKNNSHFIFCDNELSDRK